MGRDKALIEVDGVALARRVADALPVDRVVAVGGDVGSLGLEVEPDRWPGEGPLGGLATALAACEPGDVLVLAPCDWVAASAEVVERLLGALGQAAHPVVDGRGQWLPSAFRVTPELTAAVAGLVEGGARRLDAVADLVDAVGVPVSTDDVRDADTPGDLPGARPPGGRSPTTSQPDQGFDVVVDRPARGRAASRSTLFYVSHPEVAIDSNVPVPEWGLSDVGRARAEAAIERFRDVSRVISSAETKAVETAEILAGDTQVEVRPDTHENERTGFLPPAEFEQVADAFFARPDESVRGWETARAAQARIVAALADLLGPDEGDVLVVGHGAVGTLWALHLAGQPIDRAWDQPAAGCVLAVDRATGTLRHRWVRLEEV